jgi:hypothetical protein
VDELAFGDDALVSWLSALDTVLTLAALALRHDSRYLERACRTVVSETAIQQQFHSVGAHAPLDVNQIPDPEQRLRHT